MQLTGSNIIYSHNIVRIKTVIIYCSLKVQCVGSDRVPSVEENGAPMEKRDWCSLESVFGLSILGYCRNMAAGSVKRTAHSKVTTTRLQVTQQLFWALRITSLLFADDVVLLASSDHDLQHAPGRFVSECGAVGIRVWGHGSLPRNRWIAPSGLGVSLCPKRGSLSISGYGQAVRCGVSSYAGCCIGPLWWRRELSPEANLSIYQSISVPSLTYGELWVMTERNEIADTRGRNELPT